MFLCWGKPVFSALSCCFVVLLSGYFVFAFNKTTKPQNGITTNSIYISKLILTGISL